jgi:predicted dienelactone hydrolase
MRGATIAPLLCGLTLTVALGAGMTAGCAKRETTEMTQQRTEMTQDHQGWNSDLQTWETADSQLRAVMTAPPATGAHPDTTGMSDRLARLEAHEQALMQFRQAMSDLDSKLQNYQASDHAALWAEH